MAFLSNFNVLELTHDKDYFVLVLIYYTKLLNVLELK